MASLALSSVESRARMAGGKAEEALSRSMDSGKISGGGVAVRKNGGEELRREGHVRGV